MLTAIVDTREPPIIAEALQASGLVVQRAELPAGDIAIALGTGDVLLIERKTMEDLLNSIRDGRIFVQIAEMAARSPLAAIIVIGTPMFSRDDYVIIGTRKTGWRGSALRSLEAVAGWAGVPIFYRDQLPAAVKELINVARERERVHRRAGVRIIFEDHETAFLASVPGVGTKRSEAALLWTGVDGKKGTLADTIEMLTAAGIPQFSIAPPPGWRKSDIDHFREFLRLKDNEYLAKNTAA